MVDFRFTNEHGGRVGNVIDVLRRPRLWVPETDYPDYFSWLERTEAQLSVGEKRAMLALFGRAPVGTVIYQRHKTEADTVEVKNISVAPEAVGRLVGSFLLRNAEIEAITQDFQDCNKLMVDTKITNTDMISFLMRHGYELQEIVDLYALGTAEDAVFVKTVGV